MDRKVTGTAETHVTRTRVLTDRQREPFDRRAVIVIIVSAVVVAAVVTMLVIVRGQVSRQSAQIAGLRSDVAAMAGQVGADQAAVAAARAKAATLQSQLNGFAGAFPQTCSIPLTNSAGVPVVYI
ncbi:MAG: hypothetical protein ACRDN0_35065, partial [Trebonia sp.]